MIQTKAKLISNSRVKENYWHAVLNAPQIAKAASSGQFINIKVSDAVEPLLRRPLSIHRCRGSKLEILYAVIGPGTKILSRRKPGELLDVIGPLGTGFNVDSKKSRAILVAGGMGVAPLLFLAEILKKKDTRILVGAKTKSQILCEKEFVDAGCGVTIATDDGSCGFKGYVSQLLLQELKTHNAKFTTIYACGPKPMLKEISRIAQARKIPAQVSLEEHMACGIGACLGCVVNTTQGYKRVCKEGPVFEAKEIIW